jgi:two-component system sensor histidine kinase BaeS
VKHPWLRPSLFWTFAGSFLLVLLLAAVVQTWGTVAFVARVEAQRAVDRAEIATGEAAEAMGPHLETRDGRPVDGRAVGRLLHDLQPEDGRYWLVFQHREGWIEPVWRLVREEELALEQLVGGQVIGPGRPPGAPGAPRGFRPPRPGPGERDPARGGEPPGSRADDPPVGRGKPPLPRFWVEPLRRGMLQVAARRPVLVHGAEEGAVVALLPRPRTLSGLALTPTAWLFSVPVTLLLAGIAGLVLFRLLLNRLRTLEALAVRVQEGDLDARVRVSRDDEIGRLGTQLNRMTAALQEAQGKLERSDRQRRRLLADISHELATPLTSIRGYTETLLDPSVATTPEEREAYLRDVLDEARRMNLLIQDLFELTRLEAEIGGLDREPLDWTELCRNTMERFAPRFQQEGLRLGWTGPVEAAWILADGRRLEQVLDNLLVNALRYVPRGGHVQLSLEKASGGYQLAVRDDGPGIPESELPHIFDRFFRAVGARGKSGSGLGLAIVREIVERHGGTVQAASLRPAGTVFRIFLPGDDGAP